MPIKRLHYFDQQFLVEADFTDEQKYHVDMRRRLTRALHSFGIADGLTVRRTGSRQVTVERGVAIDRDGRELVLEDAQIVDVSNLTTFPANAAVFVTIAYHEEPTDPVTATGVTGDTRTLEAPLVQASTTAPPTDGSVVRLAQFTKTAGGDVPGNPDDLLDGGVRQFTSAKTAAGAITDTHLATGAVTEPKLAAGAVTETRLAAGAVTSAKVGTGAVGTAALADTAVTTAKIANAAVTGPKLAAGAVGTTNMVDESVTAAKLAGGAVTSAKIATGAVGPSNLADGVVSAAKIAVGAVITPHVADAAVTAAKLADGAVTSAKLAANSVTSAQIADGSIGATELADGAVTAAKLNPTVGRGLLLAFLSYVGNTGIIQNSLNVTSVTRVGPGQYDIRWSVSTSPHGPFVCWTWGGRRISGRGSGATLLQVTVQDPVTGGLVDDHIMVMVASIGVLYGQSLTGGIGGGQI
jgi:hypothetical protein